MTRILLVETASPKRVRKAAEELLQGPSAPRITILCTSDPATRAYFSEIPGIQVVELPERNSRQALAALREQEFELVRIFWTGERKYRRMKLAALRLHAHRVEVDSGDGGLFLLTWKALIRFGHFRWRHPLPSDHFEFTREDADANRYYQGESILLVQSAAPAYLLQALDRMRERRLFRNPSFTVFCRNRPDIVESFRNHPLIREIRTHAEARDSWRHLRALRRTRYDVVAIFLTGDPSYWKIKYFAFLLGARHRLIFNENCDCFFFSFSDWRALMARRMGERSAGGPVWFHQARLLLFLLLKMTVFPLRFAWLLFVWLRLRMAG